MVRFLSGDRSFYLLTAGRSTSFVTEALRPVPWRISDSSLVLEARVLSRRGEARLQERERPFASFRVLQVGLHIIVIAGENEDDHVRSAFEEEAKTFVGTALEEISSEPANVHTGVKMRTPEGFGRRTN
jgi:hypothetical protein